MIPSDNLRDFPTDFTVTWPPLFLGPWAHILAIQLTSTTEEQFFETVTNNLFFPNGPTSSTTYFLGPTWSSISVRTVAMGDAVDDTNFSAHCYLLRKAAESPGGSFVWTG